MTDVHPNTLLGFYNCWRVTVLAALLMLPSLVLGQEVVARLDLDRRQPTPRFIEYISADGGMTTIGNQSNKSSRYLSISKYDENFSKSWTKQVLQQSGNAEIDLLAALGDKILVFISQYTPRDRTSRTSYTQFDLAGNKVVEKKEIAELPNEKERRTDLKYIRSINKKKLLCYKNLDEGSKQDKILYYLFDAYSDEVITGEIVIPYPDDKFQVRKIMVSNAGQIYVLGKYFNVNRVKSPDDFGFKIYHFSPGESKGAEVAVELGALFITDLTLKIDRDENLFLAGFYSHKSTDDIIGTCFFRFDSDLKEILSSSQRFSDDFLSRFMKERQIERGRELQNFYLDNIILRSDGGVLLLAERFYTTYDSYVDIYGYWVDRKIYHFDEIIVNSVAANGDLEWSAVVPKRQQSERRERLSYIDVVSGASLFLVYGYEQRREPHTMYYNSLDFDGNVSQRSVLIRNNGYDDIFYPRSSEQISNTEALLVYYQEKQKIFSIVKMAFE